MSFADAVRPPFADIARGAGYFGTLTVSDTITVDGWILAPPWIRPDRFGLYIDGERIAETAAVALPEWPLPSYLPAGTVAGFTFAEVRPPFEVRELARIEVIAFVSGQAVARMGTFARGNLAALPAPPPHLMLRVTGNDDPPVVKRAGARCAKELLETMGRHRSLDSVHRILDWGCGCARVTMHLIDAFAPWTGALVEGRPASTSAAAAAASGTTSR